MVASTTDRMVASTINRIGHQQHDKVVASTTNRMVASTINRMVANGCGWLRQPSTISGCNGRNGCNNHQPSTIEHQQHDKMVASTTNRMVASTINRMVANGCGWLRQPPTINGRNGRNGCINHQPSTIEHQQHDKMVASITNRMVASTINRMVANGYGWSHQPSTINGCRVHVQQTKGSKIQPFGLLRRLTKRSQLGSLYPQSDSSV